MAEDIVLRRSSGGLNLVDKRWVLTFGMGAEGLLAAATAGKASADDSTGAGALGVGALAAGALTAPQGLTADATCVPGHRVF